MLAFRRELCQLLVYVLSYQGHKAISIHLYSLSVFVLNEVFHKFEWILEVLNSFLAFRLLSWNRVHKRVVYLIHMDRIEHYEGKVRNKCLNQLWLVRAYFYQCQLNWCPQNLVSRVMKSEQVEQQGKLGLFQVEKYVQILFVFIDLTSKQFQEVSKVGRIVFIKVVLCSYEALLIYRNHQIDILVISPDGFEKKL